MALTKSGIESGGGEELLLGSQKVEPGKLISSGYPFRYRELRESLEGLLGS